MNRREFLKLLGVTAITSAVSGIAVVDRDNESVKDIEWTRGWQFADGSRYTTDYICPECEQSADHCWCGGECIGQPCIQWTGNREVNFIEEKA